MSLRDLCLSESWPCYHATLHNDCCQAHMTNEFALLLVLAKLSHLGILAHEQLQQVAGLLHNFRRSLARTDLKIGFPKQLCHVEVVVVLLLLLLFILLVGDALLFLFSCSPKVLLTVFFLAWHLSCFQGTPLSRTPACVPGLDYPGSWGSFSD